ncbi:Importin alpha subunit (Karyopherin alpha subunit) (Serine-rich RNA polymerase I suppressor protein) [Blyttiomyces sp. JEL0837]|nr:Importin alpha subunit (Karyopherin alpha subunit) (Serine-rich RNA polymerase I suppressor protein) [Blyttiomyces sp. JEL0837]
MFSTPPPPHPPAAALVPSVSASAPGTAHGHGSSTGVIGVDANINNNDSTNSSTTTLNSLFASAVAISPGTNNVGGGEGGGGGPSPHLHHHQHHHRSHVPTTPSPHQPHARDLRATFDSDSDEDNDIEKPLPVDDLLANLNKALPLPHRGPASKAKPRKKGVDFDNEIESINRKLFSVDLIESAQVPDFLSQANDPAAVKHLLPNHGHQLIAALNHEIPDYNLNAMKQLRRYMCLDEVCNKTEQVLALGILPRIREMLLDSLPTIQYEACWVITNIAAGTSDHTWASVNADMIQPLIGLLASHTDQVRVQAAWALGNIAGDCKELTQRLLDEGIMAPLLQIPKMTSFSYKKDNQAKHVVCWCIANLCRWDIRDWDQIRPSFEMLTETTLACRDDDVLSEAIWALSRIFHARHPAISALVTKRLCVKMVHLLQSPRISIQNPVLRVMTNISGDSNPEHTQVLIDSGILFAIQSILHFRTQFGPQVIIELLHCLSNITAGTTEQKEAVSAAGLFAPCRDILENGDYKAKKEACHVFRNAVDRDATPEHFRDVVGPQGEIFSPLTKFLIETIDEPLIHLQAIETLNIIFSRGDEPLIRALYPFAAPNINVYVSCMNYLSTQNFENIWLAYTKSHGDSDDLSTQLLVQCVMNAKHYGKEVELVNQPGFKATAAARIAEQRLRKRIQADLKIMVEKYLGEQVALKRGLPKVKCEPDMEDANFD